MVNHTFDAYMFKKIMAIKKKTIFIRLYIILMFILVIYRIIASSIAS
jgi:hypothetical protein